MRARRILTLCASAVVFLGALVGDRYLGADVTTAVAVVEPTEEPYQHEVTLWFSWDAGHRIVSSSEPITITRNFITLEMRDENGDIAAVQNRPVLDCEVVYDRLICPQVFAGLA